jgi:hypothetical protein
LIAAMACDGGATVGYSARKLSGGHDMSILTRAATAAMLARTVIGHPVVQAGLAVAPLLLTPQVKAAARNATLSTAYKAGTLARKVVDATRKR